MQNRHSAGRRGRPLHHVGTSVLCAALLAVAACGGGGGGGGGDDFSGGGRDGDAGGGNGGGGNGGGGSGDGNGGTTWTPGVFQPASTFKDLCATPRPGAFPDRQGTTVDENNWLRSWSNDLYLWYDEIADRNPALFDTPQYFDLLRTMEETASGRPKDRFHFSLPTDEWEAMSQSGISAGYGVSWAVLRPTVPREIVVAFTEPGSPATQPTIDLRRGARVLEVDGVDAINDDTQGGVDTLNAGLFPGDTGESHTFTIEDPGSSGSRTFSMTSVESQSTPVQNVRRIDTDDGQVGYMLFNDHIATAEQLLIDAVNELDGVADLVLDIRYNGGGFLAIASELAYMVAGAARTDGKSFERLRFNDKHPDFNPITGEPLQPRPFIDTTTGSFSAPAGQPLPSLDLPRVFVLTGPGTCSASESIINALRGIDIQIIQIGSTTCGKPFGFFPADNCGTTYFSIQFQGVNDKEFGDYPDGFSPENETDAPGVRLAGCSLADDFSRPLGDREEGRLAAALAYRDTGNCPAPTGVAPQGTGMSPTGIRRSSEAEALVQRPRGMPGKILMR